MRKVVESHLTSHHESNANINFIMRKGGLAVKRHAFECDERLLGESEMLDSEVSDCR